MIYSYQTCRGKLPSTPNTVHKVTLRDPLGLGRSVYSYILSLCRRDQLKYPKREKIFSAWCRVQRRGRGPHGIRGNLHVSCQEEVGMIAIAADNFS